MHPGRASCQLLVAVVAESEKANFPVGLHCSSFLLAPAAATLLPPCLWFLCDSQSATFPPPPALPLLPPSLPGCSSPSALLSLMSLAPSFQYLLPEQEGMRKGEEFKAFALLVGSYQDAQSGGLMKGIPSIVNKPSM